MESFTQKYSGSGSSGAWDGMIRNGLGIVGVVIERHLLVASAPWGIKDGRNVDRGCILIGMKTEWVRECSASIKPLN